MLYRAVFLCFPGSGRVPVAYDGPLKPFLDCVARQRLECVALPGATCGEPDLDVLLGFCSVPVREASPPLPPIMAGCEADGWEAFDFSAISLAHT